MRLHLIKAYLTIVQGNFFKQHVTIWRQDKQYNTKRGLDMIKNSKQATSVITYETRKESFYNTDKKPLRKLVLTALENEELTAREIAVKMHKEGALPYPARAIIQPRITELVEEGVIKAVRKKYDVDTKRQVAVYKVQKNEM